jgi:hypothetical protein
MYQSNSQPFQPSVAAALHAWLARNRYTWSRPSGGLPGYYVPPSQLRLATVDEVADRLLADPTMRTALGVVASPAAKELEEAVAREYLPKTEADLLVSALQAAAKVAIDERRPAWQRRGALGALGVGVGIAAAAWWSRS